jgi:hypothetical protein
LRLLSQYADHFLVAAMHAVERAYGQHAAAMLRTHVM